MGLTYTLTFDLRLTFKPFGSCRDLKLTATHFNFLKLSLQPHTFAEVHVTQWTSWLLWTFWPWHDLVSSLLYLQKHVFWRTAAFHDFQKPSQPPLAFSDSIGYLTFHLLSGKLVLATCCDLLTPFTRHWRLSDTVFDISFKHWANFTRISKTPEEENMNYENMNEWRWSQIQRNVIYVSRDVIYVSKDVNLQIYSEMTWAWVSQHVPLITSPASNLTDNCSVFHYTQQHLTRVKDNFLMCVCVCVG